MASRSSGCLAPIGITRNTWNTSNNITIVLRSLDDLHGEEAHGRGTRNSGRQAASHRIVNAAAVKRFQNFLGGPRLIGSLLLRAADGKRSDLPRW